MNYKYFKQGNRFYLNGLGSVFTVRVENGRVIYQSQDTGLIPSVKIVLERYLTNFDIITNEILRVILEEVEQAEIKSAHESFKKGRGGFVGEGNKAKAIVTQSKVNFGINRPVSNEKRKDVIKRRESDKRGLLRRCSEIDCNSVTFSQRGSRLKMTVTGANTLPNAILMNLRKTGIKDIVRNERLKCDLKIEYQELMRVVIAYRIVITGSNQSSLRDMIESRLKDMQKMKAEYDSGGWISRCIWVFESNEFEMQYLEDSLGSVEETQRILSKITIPLNSSYCHSYGMKHTAFIALQSAQALFESKSSKCVSEKQEQVSGEGRGSIGNNFLGGFLKHICQIEESDVDKIIARNCCLAMLVEQTVNELQEQYGISSKSAAIVYTAVRSMK